MIMEEGGPYCRGIVFKLSDIGSAGNATVKESGDANCFTILGEDRNWLAAVQFNGELPVPTQRSLIRRMANAERMYDALKRIRDRADKPGAAGAVDAVYCFIEAEKAIAIVDK